MRRFDMLAGTRDEGAVVVREMIKRIAHRGFGTTQQLASVKQSFFGGYAFADVEHEVGAERSVGGGCVRKVENGWIGDDLFHG
ncbi:hypothetical protein D3C76_1547560 [compost metagenome]